MNKEIKVLYKIFELEMAPPFEFFEELPNRDAPYICNKHSEKIGWYSLQSKHIHIYSQKMKQCLDKIKKTFNVDQVSDDDVYYVIGHFVVWLQDNFPGLRIDSAYVWDAETGNDIYYPNVSTEI